jgi:hypothetical protein
MTESTEGTGARRPYVKPFVRNLDVEDTENKAVHPSEGTSVITGGGGGGIVDIPVGPS